MIVKRKSLQLCRLGVIVGSLLVCTQTVAQTSFVTIDRFVPHTSTVPANEGERIGLFLREKMSRATADAIARGETPPEIVLFVHGGTVPSVPDYDLQYADYSWMEYLAEAGFDTFALDHTGYGLSPRPEMDNPCNMAQDNQAKIIPNPLSSHCDPEYKRTLTSLSSDWDEIDAAVDYIAELRDVARVHLIGWSRGGRRVGGYAASHPDKLDRIILFAPGYDPTTPSAPAPYHSDGVPMALQTRDALMSDRWQSAVACENQVDPGIREVIWQTIMAFDPLGAVWGPPEGVMRVRTGTDDGWNREAAQRISTPTMIMVGEQDGLLDAGRVLYQDLEGTSDKVIVEMACATHFAVWEATQYKFMHEASLEWLSSGTFRNQKHGAFSVGVYKTAE